MFWHCHIQLGIHFVGVWLVNKLFLSFYAWTGLYGIEDGAIALFVIEDGAIALFVQRFVVF